MYQDSRSRQVSLTGYGSRSANHIFNTSYHNNGSGRDTYISFDNGGNYLMYEASKNPDLGTTFYASKKSYLYGSPSRDGGGVRPKNVFYQINGTGRDTYIS